MTVSFSFSPLDDEDTKTLGAWVRARMAGKEAETPASLVGKIRTGRAPVYLGVRAAGELRFTAWDAAEASEDPIVALARLLDKAASRDKPSADEGAHEYAEIAFCWDGKDRNPYNARGDFGAVMWNVHRGRTAIQIRMGGRTDRITPFDITARNLMIHEYIDEYREQRGIPEARFKKRAKFRVWETNQFVVDLEEDNQLALYRCAPVVHPLSVDKSQVEELQQKLGDYLFSHVNELEHLTYKLEPTRGEDPDGDNNMIRTWMATVAMDRASKYRNESEECYAIVERNIRFNLKNYYHATAELGLIQWRQYLPLGNIAIAVMALMEHPKREEWKRIERKLFQTIDYAWQPDGSFMTMLKPVDFEHGRNFYPGEALLAHAFRYAGLPAEERSDEFLEKFMHSMRYWRDWHRIEENRKPAFVPWHVMAYYVVWEVTQDDELKDWIFEMSDWLCEVQQGYEVIMPDFVGRYYDPKRPHFGTPHSSSTGVYCEGMIDAFELARRVGDEERVARYRTSLLRAWRSVQQCCYWEPIEAWYAIDPERCVGGVRNNEFSTIIRCDNVQHNLMAIIKTLYRFTDEDWAVQDPEAPAIG